MKKVLLVVGLLMAGFISSFAQLGTNFIYDDFQTSTPYGGATSGVYWFSDTNLPIYAIKRDGNGKFTITQNTSTVVGFQPGGGNALTSASELYAVVGVSIGPGNTIDLSGNATMNFTVLTPATANTANLDLTFQITDENNNQVSIRPDTVVGACAWGAGGSKYKYQTQVALSSNSVVSFNFAGGFVVNTYSCGDQCACPSVKPLNTFNYAKVKQLELLISGGCSVGQVVVNGNAGPCFNSTITVTGFSLGNVPAKLSAPVPTSTVTSGVVDLSWPAVSGATLYNILTSSVSGSGFTLVATSSAPSWTTTTSGSSTVFYKVGAFNGINSYSAELSFVPSVATNIYTSYELSSAVNVAPNPTSEGYINVTSGLNISNISVVNAQGAPVNTSVNGNRVNTTTLTPGVYTLLIDTEKGRTAKKFIVE